MIGIRGISAGILIFLLTLPRLAVAAQPTDPADSVFVPQTGDIVTADPTYGGTGNQDIRFVIKSGAKSELKVETVSADPRDDREPRVGIEPDGDAWVVWWRNNGGTSSVVARKRNAGNGTWGEEGTISDPESDSLCPSLAHDGDRPWVAYEVKREFDTDIEVSIIIDDPDPQGLRAVVGTTAYDGDLDVRIHHQAGQLWVTWVDSESDVAWVVYDPDTEQWSAASFESYAGDEIGNARDRIAALLGG